MTQSRKLTAGLLICALGAAAYLNSFSVPFHFDDEIHVTENPYVRLTSLDAHALLGAMVQDRKQNRPFSNLTLALNYYIHQENVFGYHLVNLALHLFAGLCLFALLLRLFARARLPEDRRFPAALAVVAVWLVHPLHTQAVSYIVQRQTVMAGAFTLACLAAYAAGREAESRAKKIAWYALAALSGIIAAGSKETALVLPLLIFHYELYFYQDFSLGFLRRHPMTMIVAAILFSSLFILYARPEMWAKVVGGYANYPFTLSERLLTEPRVLWQYVGLILLPLPSRLSLEHDPALSVSLLSPWTTLPALLGWLAIFVAAFLKARKWRLLSFAVFWYLINLLLESSFLPLDLMLEHRLYLPSLALLAPLVGAVMFSRRTLPQAAAIVTVVVALLAAGTVARNRVWQSAHSLWADSTVKAPGEPRAWINLCSALLRENDFSGAVAACHRAVRLQPGLADPYDRLGVAYFQLGDPAAAEAAFRKAVALQPDADQALFNLGELLRQTDRDDEAIAMLQRTLAANPNHHRAHWVLGRLDREQGNLEAAAGHFRAAVKLAPYWIQAHYDLADTLRQAGDCPAAMAAAQAGLVREPGRPELEAIIRSCR